MRYRVVTTVAALLLCLGLIACFVPGGVPAATSGEGDGRAALTAEELSESATARGIEHPGKMSSWRPIGFHIQDVTVVLLFLALCLGGICCKGVLP